MNYRTMPMNLLPNGLTLLQQNPDCAAKLDPTAKDHGWLYTRGSDGQWVTLRQMSAAEIETAYDQAADMAVLQGTQVRAGQRRGKRMTTALQMMDEATTLPAVGIPLDRRVMRPVERLRTVAALYVEPEGCYVGVPGVDPWDEARDARDYNGPHPVVAHPPCQRWGRFWHGSTRKPHQFFMGDDRGCFLHALASVRRWGGVLEHPADTHAWERFGILKPPRNGGWVPARAFPAPGTEDWTCCVYQGHYGHPSGKATWLYVSGVKREDLPMLTWGKTEQRLPEWMIERYGYEKARRIGVVAMVGGKNKTAIRNATPEPFRDLLLSIARQAHNAK